MPIKGSINVTRINKDRIKPGKNGKYLGFVFFEKPDQYGNSGFICEDVSQEERAQGIKGNIIGNWKDTSKAAPKKEAPPAPTDDGDSIPF